MEDRTAGKSILQETTDSSCVTGKIGFVLFFFVTLSLSSRFDLIKW